MALLYYAVRPIARVAFGTYFRKIFLSGLENIPKDAGVILAANHPTAFIEPCVLACWLDRPLYFLVRGDLFDKPLYARLMNGLHMLPIFRQDESGIQAVRENYKVLDAMSQALGEGKTVMVLAEGHTVHEKRLRPIRKAVARLAFRAAGQFPDKEIYVVPVGVNYTYSDRFRSEVMMEFGQPMRIADYKELYEAAPPRALRDFTRELRDRLAKQIVIIDRKEDEELVERLLVLYRSERKQEPLLPVGISEPRRFKMEKAIADKVNAMNEKEKQALSEKVSAYWQRLKEKRLSDWAVVHGKRMGVGRRLFLWMGAIPFALGYLFNYFILYLAHALAMRKVKRKEFQASVAIGIAMGLYLLYFVLLLIAGAIWAGWQGVLVAFAVPLFGFFALYYWEQRKLWKQEAASSKYPQKLVEELRQQREHIFNILGINVAN